MDYTPPLLLRAGQTMGLRGFALYRYLILPASLPAYVAGMKQGWAFAWRSLMAGELFVPIIGQFSIGQLLSVDQQNLDFTGVSARSSSSSWSSASSSTPCSPRSTSRSAAAAACSTRRQP